MFKNITDAVNYMRAVIQEVPQKMRGPIITAGLCGLWAFHRMTVKDAANEVRLTSLERTLSKWDKVRSQADRIEAKVDIMLEIQKIQSQELAKLKEKVDFLEYARKLQWGSNFIQEQAMEEEKKQQAGCEESTPFKDFVAKFCSIPPDECEKFILAKCETGAATAGGSTKTQK